VAALGPAGVALGKPLSMLLPVGREGYMALVLLLLVVEAWRGLRLWAMGLWPEV
jgi:hypothetical protein